MLRGVVDAVIVYGGRNVGRCGLHSLLRVAHGHTSAHGGKHRQVVLAVAKGNRLARVDAQEPSAVSTQVGAGLGFENIPH